MTMRNIKFCPLLLLLLVVVWSSARFAGFSKRGRMANGRLLHARQFPSTYRSRSALPSDDDDYDNIAPKHHEQQYKHAGQDYSSGVSYQSRRRQDKFPNYEETQIDPTVMKLIEALVTHTSFDHIAFRRFMETAGANMDNYDYQEYGIAPEDQRSSYENSAVSIISSNDRDRSYDSANIQNGRSNYNRQEICSQFSREKWDYDHVLVCNQTREMMSPTSSLVHKSHTYDLTDQRGNLVEVLQGWHGGRKYNQKVEVHWCVEDGAKCKGVFGNSECQMEVSIVWLHYREINTGDSSIKLGGVKVPSHCSCMLVPYARTKQDRQTSRW